MTVPRQIAVLPVEKYTAVTVRPAMENANASLPTSPVDGPLSVTPDHWVRWLCIAQSWAFFLALPELIDIASETSRYFLHWSWQTWAVRCGGVTLLGLVIFFVGLCLRTESLRARHRLGAILAFVCIGFIAWYGFTELAGPLYTLLFKYSPGGVLLGVLLASISWAKEWTLERWARGLCNLSLICFPAIPLFWTNTLLAHKYHTHPMLAPSSVRSNASDLSQQTVLAEEPKAKANPMGPPELQKADNIYFFILDAWSYRLTIEDARVLETLPHIREFSQHATFFTDAHSPGCHTSTSMPRFLYQREDDFAIKNGETGFVDKHFRPTNELDSIFVAARRSGYRTYMLGWYHPYQSLLGTDADYVHATCYFDDFGIGLGNRLKSFYWNLSARVLGKAFARLTIGDTEVIRNYSMSRSMEEIAQYTLALLEEPVSDQFAVLHIPAPHWPFCYGHDGLKNLQGHYGAQDVNRAVEQLKYTDGIVGKFLTSLKERDKYENSTIILMSDHTWRFDQAIDQSQASVRSHIPLMIKLPGQNKPSLVTQPFSTSRLLRFLQAVHEGNLETDEFNQVIADGDYYCELSDSETQLDKPLILP